LRVRITPIGVCGGYFSGKTIIANEISSLLKIPYIIHTDLIRILLQNFINKNIIKTPTYLLTMDELIEQFSLVSEYTVGLSIALMKRGELHIIEGLHFSNLLIDHLTENGILIYILNKYPLERRISLKKRTRTKLRSINGRYIDSTLISDPKQTMYFKYKENINKIDNYLDKLCARRADFIVELPDVQNRSIEEISLEVSSLISSYIK